ncbi:DUF975 family protein [Sebaldella sp. S0638]|uniref:DUF975 family protein n=1 Tax=Sebaldella sp. S0638 TaxID=2957809 RepID=UPI00209EA7E9|nr:hypothetical protein [Sebaldella sp. S0638]
MVELKKVFLKSAYDYRKNWMRLLIISGYILIWTMLESFIEFGGIIRGLTVAPLLILFQVGGTYFCLKIARKEEVKVAKSLFKGFVQNPKRLIALEFLENLYCFLWTFLLVVPGFMKMIAYSQSIFLFLENPELTAKECLKKSETMMDGNKKKYFWMIFLVSIFPILIMLIVPPFIIRVRTYYFLSEIMRKNMIYLTIITSIIYPFSTLLNANFYIFLTDGDLSIKNRKKEVKFSILMVFVSILLPCLSAIFLANMEISKPDEIYVTSEEFMSLQFPVMDREKKRRFNGTVNFQLDEDTREMKVYIENGNPVKYQMYHQNKNLNSETNIGGNWEIIRIYKLYNKKGELIYQEDFGENSTGIHIITYDNDVISSVSEIENTVTKNECTYDITGKLTMYTKNSDDEENDEESKSIVYTYDLNGKLLKIMKTTDIESEEFEPASTLEAETGKKACDLLRNSRLKN